MTCSMLDARDTSRAASIDAVESVATSAAVRHHDSSPKYLQHRSSCNSEVPALPSVQELGNQRIQSGFEHHVTAWVQQPS
jgi:hypothetical protein